jgi:hypothetical protein
MRHAIAKVEVLLHELEPSAPVEVLTEPAAELVGKFVPGGDAEHPTSVVIESTVVDGFVLDQLPHHVDAPADAPALDPECPAGRLEAQSRTAEARAETAGEVERLLVQARLVAERLHADERRAAAAMLVQAQRAAEDILIEAQRVAARLHSEQSQAAGVLLIEAERVASRRAG